MSGIIRSLLGLDRSFFLAVSSLLVAVLASVYLVFAPFYEQKLTDGTTRSATLIEVNGAAMIALLLIGPLIAVVPMVVLPARSRPAERSQKINSVAASCLLVGFVVVTIFSVGLLYVPALILSIASTVSLFFRKVRAAATGQPSTGKHGRSGGKRGSADGRDRRKRRR